jgi:molecular chaperone GrpE
MGEGEQEIRVTDRRRVYLDEDGEEKTATQAEVPNLKPKYVEELEARTRAAEQQVREVQSRFEQLRSELQRETDETRQRLNRAADERARQEKANFIASLLPVLDNLERAVMATSEGSSDESIIEGLLQTISTFERSLTAANVEPMVTIGELFNPEVHEAVETTEVDPEMENRIVAEHTRGYRLGDRLLRPARVNVGRAGERKHALN